MTKAMLSEPLLEIKNRLRKSSKELSQLKLFQSARWSSEALTGMCEIPEEQEVKEFDDESPLKNRTSITATNSFLERGFQEAEHLEDKQYDLFLLASNLFDCKEYDRCAYFLRNEKHPRLKFLRLYSRFLSWDKKTQESSSDVLTKPADISQKDPAAGTNVDDWVDDRNSVTKRAANIQSQMVFDLGTGEKISITLISRELESYLIEIQQTDSTAKSGLGFALLYYLRGILEKKQGLASEAIKSLVKSLELYPFNWTCWCELSTCITRTDESLLLLKHLRDMFPLDEHDKDGNSIMLRFFKIYIFKDFGGEFENFMDELDYLLNIFPNFSFLKSELALINYHYMDYANAELIFDEIVKLDPYRLDDLDTYSNILYVIQKPHKLAYLSQFAADVDAYRPETCCIIANYFSAKQQHEKAIMYFRRALTLNKTCTNAWTLMGHEFVEMKNSHAAIECYRRAVDINPCDFKAWYGLGQAYEVLDRHLYALYYLQKACSLKPLDKRMWQALANCYDKLDRPNQAIKCFQRASQLSNDQDITILFYLATLYERVQDAISCKNYMLKCIEVEEANQGVLLDECAKARLWLARHEVKHRNFPAAYNYASGVTHGTSQEIEAARVIARECRKRMEYQ
ncbi:HEL092Wp [Eremothecium sinecaudum]|uniref:HEL092Wp n=1 Tax=Eremothecium sinecaudum TaxID=45286 RepID=A0A0X8HTL6_9SACH|nr:HEL092Wp [Eremothecium sinecaudum]AMD21188.1 HEL092Wp [Eremothecium sinecaudum]